MPHRVSHGPSDRFYLALTIVFALTAFVGFTPTYFLPLAEGTFPGRPIQHIHGTLFFAWTIFLVGQAALMASGRRDWHRQLGMAGIALAALMAASVILSVINSIGLAAAAGQGDAARRFSIVAISALIVFVVVLAVAIANVRRPEIHRRLIVCTMPAFADAALGRLYGTLIAPPGPPGPPPVELATEFPAMLFIVAGMVYDWRNLGRVHPAYWFGLAVNGLIFVRVPLSETESWMAIARWIESLA